MGLKDNHEFIDLYSFDPLTAAEFGLPVDQCKGMILLFPLKEDEDLAEYVPNAPNASPSATPKFIKQTIENSCCLMALLHILLNNSEELIDNSKPEAMKKLIENKINLEKLIEESKELELIHKEMALIGGTHVPDITDNVQYHFVALIPAPSNSSAKSSVWLMDGRRSGPIEFEQEEGTSLFEAACKISNEEFVMKSSDQTNFAAVILI